MRRRLAGGVLLPYLVLSLAGACSTFGDEDTNGNPTPVADAGSDASSTGDGAVVPPDAGGDGASFCGTCEGPCLPSGGGCVPFEPAPDIPPGDVTGLEVALGNVYLATTSRGGSLWRIDIPKRGLTSSPVMMVVDANATGVALSNNYVHSAMATTPAGKTFLGHVVKGAGVGAGVLRSDLPSSYVAANDDYVYAATNTLLHACDRTNLYVGCSPMPGNFEIAKLAGAGNAYCLHGRYDDLEAGATGARGVYCGTNIDAPALRGEVDTVNAIAMRGARVFWADPTSITTTFVAGGALTPIAAPGVTALAADNDDLVVATDTQIYRCPKDDCQNGVRKVLTEAKGIDRIALSIEHAYFTYGDAGAKRLGRVPRRP